MSNGQPNLVDLAMGGQTGIPVPRVDHITRQNAALIERVEGSNAVNTLIQEPLQQAREADAERLGVVNPQVENAMKDLVNLRLETPAGGNIPAMIREISMVRGVLENAREAVSETVTRVRSDSEEAITKIKASEIKLQTQESQARSNRENAILIISERSSEVERANLTEDQFDQLEALIKEKDQAARAGVSENSINGYENMIAEKLNQLSLLSPDYTQVLSPILAKQGKLDQNDLQAIKILSEAATSISNKKREEESEMVAKRSSAEAELAVAQEALPAVTYVRESTEEPSRILDEMRREYSEAHARTTELMDRFDIIRRDLLTTGFDTQEKLNLLPSTDEELRKMIAYAEQFRASLDESTPTVAVDTALGDNLINALPDGELKTQLRSQMASVNVAGGLEIPNEAKPYIDQMRNIMREVKNPNGTPVDVSQVLNTLRNYQTLTREVSNNLGTAVRRERALATELMNATRMVAMDTRTLQHVNELMPRVLQSHMESIDELVQTRRSIQNNPEREAALEEARENLADLLAERDNDTPGPLGRLNLAYRFRQRARNEEIARLKAERDALMYQRAQADTAVEELDNENPNIAAYDATLPQNRP